jgi:uncharacterized membrane protein
LQVAAIAAAVLGYAALSQYSSWASNSKGLGTALSIGPVLLIGAALLWRWTQPLIALLATAFSCAVIYHDWALLERNYEWADLLQQCALYALVSLSFARTLFADRVPLCTQLSVQMHGALLPVELAYTRRATIAWAVFYLVIAATILILFFVASQGVWSAFVNFATFGLITMACLADHALRRRVLPRRPGGLLAMLQRSLIG